MLSPRSPRIAEEHCSRSTVRKVRIAPVNARSKENKNATSGYGNGDVRPRSARLRDGRPGRAHFLGASADVRGWSRTDGKIHASHVLHEMRRTGFRKRKVLLLVWRSGRSGHGRYPAWGRSQFRGSNDRAVDSCPEKNSATSFFFEDSAHTSKQQSPDEFRPHRRRPLHAGANHCGTLPCRGFGGPRRNG